MILRCLFVLFICFAQDALAQEHFNQIPDSLRNRDFDYLFDRIEEGPNRSVYLRSFLLKAKLESNWEELSNAYKNYVHYAPDSLKFVFADSMVIAAKRSHNNEIIGSAYLSKGIAYYGRKRLAEAMDIYLIADSYIKKTDDKYLIHKTKYHIGQIKYYLGYYDEAILIFEECISYFKNSNVRAYLNSLHSLGVCYKMVGNHGLCTSTNEKGIAEGLKTGNHDMDSYFIFSEGVNQCKIHNYKAGIEKLEKAMPGVLENKDFSNEMVGYFYLGRCYWGLNNKEKAIAYFKKVDQIYVERDYMRPDLREAYEFMINYYKSKDMIRSQLHYIEKLLEVDKKLHHTFAYLQGKIRKEYETKELLAAQRTLKGTLERQGRNNQILFYASSVMFIFIVYGIGRYFKNKKEARISYEALLKRIEDLEKSKDRKVDESDFLMSRDAERAMLYRLQKFEKSKRILEPDLDLTKMAGYFNTNTKYLSQIIARHRNKRFSEYINELKIEYIAQRIRNERLLRNYTHEALAEEAGFSSTRRFVNAFVSSTGITLKYFIEELKKEDNEG